MPFLLPSFQLILVWHRHLCYAGLHTRGLNSTITTLTEAGTKYTTEMRQY